MTKHKILLLTASVLALSLTAFSPVASAGCTETRVGKVQCLDYKGRVISSKICDKYSTNVNAQKTNRFSSLFRSKISERGGIFGFRAGSASETEEITADDQVADVSHNIGEKPRAPTRSCPVACPQPPSSNNDNGDDNGGAPTTGTISYTQGVGWNRNGDTTGCHGGGCDITKY